MDTHGIVDLIRSSIARDAYLPLNHQLRCALEMAAVGGELPDGLQLPSVRTLARELDLAPNTVVRAYRELEVEGIVKVSARRGYFVAGPSEAVPGPALSYFQGLVDEALQAAEMAGLDTFQFLQVVSSRIRMQRGRQRQVAVVGDRDAALAERVEIVAHALSDLAVRVVGLSFEELATAAGQARATGVELYLVPLLDLERAEKLLGPHAHRVLPMYFVLKPEVREYIASRSSDTRFGIVTSRDRYRARLVTMVRRIHTERARVISASIEDPAAVDRVIRESELLLVGSPAYPKIRDQLPPSLETREMTFHPDGETINRLRLRLGADVGHARRRRFAPD